MGKRYDISRPAENAITRNEPDTPRRRLTHETRRVPLRLELGGMKSGDRHRVEKEAAEQAFDKLDEHEQRLIVNACNGLTGARNLGTGSALLAIAALAQFLNHNDAIDVLS